MLPMRDTVVSGSAEDEAYEEVGVDIAEALDLLDSRDRSGDITETASRNTVREATVTFTSCHFCYQPCWDRGKVQPIWEHLPPDIAPGRPSGEETLNCDPAANFGLRFLKLLKSKSVSQSSSGVFSESKQTLGTKFDRIGVSRRVKQRLKNEIRFEEIKMADYSTSSPFAKRVAVEFNSVLSSAFSKEEKSSLGSLADCSFLKNDTPVFHSHCKIKLGELYEAAEIFLTPTRFVAVSENNLQCDILMADISTVTIDPTFEMCGISLERRIQFTVQCLDDLSSFLALLEYFKRMNEKERFTNFLQCVSWTELIGGGGRVPVYCRLLRSATISEKVRENDLQCESGWPIREGYLMYTELDDVIEARATEKWKMGHFLLKLNTLYLTDPSSPPPDFLTSCNTTLFGNSQNSAVVTPDSNRKPRRSDNSVLAIPGKFWLLADDCESSDDSTQRPPPFVDVLDCSEAALNAELEAVEVAWRPNTFQLRWRRGGFGLRMSASGSKEAEEWVGAIKRAREFKSHDLRAPSVDAENLKSSRQVHDDCSVCLTTDHLTLFQFGGEKSKIVERMKIADVFDVDNVGTSVTSTTSAADAEKGVVVIKFRDHRHLQLKFQRQQDKEELIEIMNNIMALIYCA